MAKRKTIDHEMMIATQVTNVSRHLKKGPTITIGLDFPDYLPGTKQEAEILAQKLIEQLADGPIKIKGLSLKWFEDIEES